MIAVGGGFARVTAPARRGCTAGGLHAPESAERGSAMVWSSLVMVLIAGLATLLLGAGVLTARGYAAQGAADLAALAGATAQLAGREACSEATRSAARNGAEVTACTVAGDEVEVVVTVDVEIEAGIGPWRTPLSGHANAGVLTGAPE